MGRYFDNPEWHRAVAALIRSSNAASMSNSLAGLVGQVVRHEGTCLLAFDRNAPPEVIHHTLEPAGAEHYLGRYLAGPYLLDPLYELAISGDRPTLCRFRDQSPDRFRSSEYYRQYCERTHLLDEMDYLVGVTETVTLVLVVGRREKMFMRAELERLRLIEPVVVAAMRNIWDSWLPRDESAGRDQNLHRRLMECFDTFGEAVLTEREREITRFLLRGHSVKSVARQLDIAPGTVMVHKRNLFKKLGISSQYELFSRFIEKLSAS